MSSAKGTAIERTFLVGGVSLVLLGTFLHGPSAHAQSGPPPGAPPPPTAAPSGSAPPAAPGPAVPAQPAPPTLTTPPPSQSPAPAAAPPAGPPPAPGPTPPPYLYQEPWTPPPGDPPRPYAPTPPQYRGSALPPDGPPPYPPPGYPPAYFYEAPPPPRRWHRAPYNALWLGARVGALLPFGNAYSYPVTRYSGIGERWAGLAGDGVAVEGDVGARFARYYIIYGFWEHGRLGTGDDSSWRSGATGFGDQVSATTDFAGAGLRWSSRPDTVGLVLDAGLGYRWFRERWSTDTKMDLQGFGEFRLGFGADVRLSRAFSLSPMLMFSYGVFSDRQISINGGPKQTITADDGRHGTVNLSIGGHFDLGS